MIHFETKTRPASRLTASRLILPMLAISLYACVPAPSTQTGTPPAATPSQLPETPAASPSGSVSQANPSPVPSATQPASPLPSPAAETPAPGASPGPGPSLSPGPLPGQAPAAPGNLRIVERGTSYLTLQWDFGGEAVSYRLLRDGEAVAENHTTPDYYRFEGLSPSTSYRLGVQALNPAGQSEVISLTVATPASGRSASGNFSSAGNGNTRSSVSPATGQFRVNGTTLGNQSPQDVATAADGAFVIVWTSGDILSSDIYAQRYDSRGRAIGSEFLVNTYTTGQQTAPTIAMQSDGDFIVAWSGPGPVDERGIQARHFEADGDALGEQFQINTFTSGTDLQPDVALNDSGDFVVSWWNSERDGGGAGVYARSFTAGSADGDDFQVHDFVTGLQYLPSVGIDELGEFCIVWTSINQDGSDSGIFARRYSAGASPGSEFRVNDFTTGAQNSPSIAMAADGDFIVVWESETDEAGSYYSIRARRFDLDGEPIDEEFAIESEDAPDLAQYSPSVALDGDGDFAVAWETYDPASQDTEITARRFDRDGDPDGAEFRVNTYTSGTQGAAKAALADNGRLIVSWSDFNGQDGDGHGVYARFYR